MLYKSVSLIRPRASTTSGIWKSREKRVPRLHATDPLGQLSELRALLETMRSKPAA